MSSSEPPLNMGLTEYRQWELQQKERHEYWQGNVYSQAGGTRKHSLIAANLLGEVRSILKGKPCEAHGSDMRVYSATPAIRPIPMCPWSVLPLRQTRIAKSAIRY
jgi:Uma2 family endonuclease